MKIVSLNAFHLEYPIGRGGFGKVWKVRCKLNNKYYAIKIMSKLKIIKKNSVKNINNEKKFLSILNNSFLVNMICSFQDNENLYLVMDLLLGGDMRYHINKRAVYNKKNDESQLKFIAGCVLVGLNYIHEKQIIHKDIKPENLVYDSRGYIHITDFGISKIYHPDNGKENSGTPGYMAPEVLFNKDHNFSVDYFSLGVILYELLMGRRPYHGHSKKELRKDIVSRQARIKEDNIPDGFIKSNTFLLCADFINKLLERKKEKRLGYLNFKEIKDHPWLIDFNWEDLINKKMKPYFIPPISDSNYDKKYCNEPEKIGDETQKEYESIKNKYDYNKLFLNYTSNNKQFLEKIKLVTEQKNKKNLMEKEKEKNDRRNISLKKDVNMILKDTKILRSLFKNDTQLIQNNSSIKLLINQNNERRNSDIKTLKVKKNLKSNHYNDISLSTTKNNSNISTNNIINDYYPMYNKDDNKFKSYNYKFLKDESAFNHTNFNNSIKMIKYFKNRSQIDFYKKNTQKKLPFIYKHLKKSISVENMNRNKQNNNIFGFAKRYAQKNNPITMYEKYFPLRNSSINIHYKNHNSFINNYI